MELKAFIESGVIEMYCMGLASEEEVKLVHSYMLRFPEVKKEIDAVQLTLVNYASLQGIAPRESVKQALLKQATSEQHAQRLPPQLNECSQVEFWLQYLEQSKLEAPKAFTDLYSIDLHSNENQVTYAVWAKSEAFVEETHANETEYLLMLRGKCSVTFAGKSNTYGPGDLITIPAQTAHKAVSLSDDMLLIGQRLALK